MESVGALYQQFYHTYDGYSLEELRSLLKQRTIEWCEWINSLREEELFHSGVRKWTVTGANGRWEMVAHQFRRAVQKLQNQNQKVEKHAG